MKKIRDKIVITSKVSYFLNKILRVTYLNFEFILILITSNELFIRENN
jgi:hypothetical protein